MYQGPVASKICFLSSLPDQKTGEKVRFLGCVTAYNTETACLTLGHMYPPNTNILVSVTIELVLETLQPGMTRIGEWLNVVGYVVDRPVGERDKADAHVQALMVWPTGPMNVQQYEGALEDGILGAGG